MAARIQPGDVFEIKTKKGLAYAQYVLKNAEMGTLIRVLPSVYAIRPDSFHEVVSQPERFVTFFPLQAAADKGIVEIVAHESIPPSSGTMPLFRARGHIDRDGYVHDWRLWDGEKSVHIGKLSHEQRKLPIKELWNDTLLIERIEQEWTPEKEPLREPGLLRRVLKT
jgi:hypothetical protein